MAALVTIGPGFNTIAAAAAEWDVQAGAGISISSTTHRNNKYSVRCNAMTSLQKTYVGVTYTPNGNVNYYVRFYLLVHALPNVANTIFNFSDGVLSNLANVFLTTTGALTVNGNATTSGNLSLDVWHLIEFHLDNTQVGSTDIMELRVDGSQVYLSNNTSIGNTTQLHIGGNIQGEACTSGDWFFSDFAVNDTTGTTETSWVGPGQTAYLVPAAAGDNNTWQTSAGGAGSATNLSAVNEDPPDDATTYLKRISTTIKVDDYKVTSPATPGIAAADKIKVVMVGVRGGATAATAAAGRNILTRIKSAAAGTVHKSAGPGLQATTTGTTGLIKLNTTTWLTNTLTVPPFIQLVSYVDPTTGVAWTRDGTNSLSNMQIGMENETSTSTEVRVTSIWAVVRYMPANVAALGTALSASTAISLPGTKSNPASTAVAKQLGQPLTGTKSASCSTAVAKQLGMPLTSSKGIPLGIAVAKQLARALAGTKTASLSTSTARQTALALSGTKSKALATASSRQTALSFSGSKLGLMETAVGVEIGRLLLGTKLMSIALAHEGDAGLPVVVVRPHALGTAVEVDTARRLAEAGTVLVHTAVMVEVALALGMTISAPPLIDRELHFGGRARDGYAGGQTSDGVKGGKDRPDYSGGPARSGFSGGRVREGT